MTIRARSKTFAVSLITAIGVGIGCVPALHAQEKYPSRPIRFLIPFPPGGAADIIGRTIGEKISARLGQPVVMDNRPGAGGAVATAILAKSEPDGYTILVGLPGPIAISPRLLKLPYKPDRDLLPITRVSETLDVMVVPTASGIGLSNWNGIFAPAPTPAPVVDRLFAEINRVLTAPDLKEKQNTLGIDPVGSASPQEFSQFVRSETAKWGKIVHDANIKLD